jgi:teichuronic acid biosynthesis glycosyltransferase TuaC
MRVAVVTTSYPAYDGDPSGHFVAAEVRELEAGGHEVIVIAPRPGGAFGWPGAASRLRARPWRVLDAAGWVFRAAMKVRRARVDRIVAHWSVPSALIAAAGDAEVEVVSHGGDVRLLLALPAKARVALVKRLARRAASWRFVSSKLRDDLAAVLPHDVGSALLAIATVGASPLGMPDVRDASRARRASLEGRRLYVCAGRLVASKRVDKVIDYVASRRHDLPVLVVLGDGPERSQLERQARRWSLDARFLGTTPRHEALTWIGAADEVVHASLAEGASTVIREAEELGVPVTLL